MDGILEMVRALGLPVSLVIFLTWWLYNNQRRDQQEKQNLALRLNKIEDYQKEKLERLLISTQESINKNTASQNRLIEALNLRPCISGKVKVEGGKG